jgi:hypothetical protein
MLVFLRAAEYFFMMVNCGVRSCVEGIIQGILRLVDITAGGDFLSLCDQKSS